MNVNLIFCSVNELFASIMPENINYGLLLSVAILLGWLIGIICDWKWTYTRPGGARRNYLLNILGPKAYRWLLGVVLFVMLVLLLFSIIRSE